MPRNARIDAPGTLHHIIVRGIERRRIFSDDQDRENFIERLGGILTETQAICLALSKETMIKSFPIFFRW